MVIETLTIKAVISRLTNEACVKRKKLVFPVETRSIRDLDIRGKTWFANEMTTMIRETPKIRPQNGRARRKTCLSCDFDFTF